MSSIFAANYRMALRHPMDSSFFLSLSACVSSLMYIGTLLLNVQFRGDFGIMTDQAVLPSTVYDSGGDSGSTGGIRSGSSGLMPMVFLGSGGFKSGTVYEDGANSSSHGAAQHAAQSVGELLSVPIGDISLLFAPKVSGFGTRLYNLKVGLKDK